MRELAFLQATYRTAKKRYQLICATILNHSKQNCKASSSDKLPAKHMVLPQHSRTKISANKLNLCSKFSFPKTSRVSFFLGISCARRRILPCAFTFEIKTIITSSNKSPYALFRGEEVEHPSPTVMLVSLWWILKLIGNLTSMYPITKR